MRAPMLNRGRILLAIGYALLLSAWVVSMPPFGNPDEWAHYIRVVALGGGDLFGREASEAQIQGQNPEERAFIRRISRVFSVGTNLDPADYGCYQMRPNTSAACTASARTNDRPVELVSIAGVHHPYAYLVPAVFAFAANDAGSADLLARFGAALISFLLLLVVVVMAAKDRLLVSFCGPAVALTPSVLALSSSPNPSALETMGAVAFASTALTLSRPGGRSRHEWILLALCGSVLGMSKTLSPVWICITMAAALLLTPRGERARWSSPPARWAAAAVVLFTLAGVAWQVGVGASVPVRFAATADEFGTAFARVVPTTFTQAVGNFQYLDTPMARWTYWAWGIATCIVIAGALFYGQWTERALVIGLVAGALIFPTILYLALIRDTGFHIQGRYVLAQFVVLPLTAGEILTRRLPTMARWWMPCLSVLVLLCVSAVHIGGVWANARRSATGTDGPWWFLPVAEWSPFGGWTFWLLMTLVGALLIALGPMVESFSPAWRSRVRLSASFPRWP